MWKYSENMALLIKFCLLLPCLDSLFVMLLWIKSSFSSLEGWYISSILIQVVSHTNFSPTKMIWSYEILVIFA